MNIDTNLPFLQKFCLKKIIKPPLKARHNEFTIISSMDDENARPNQNLINLSLESISRANQINMNSLYHRKKGGWVELNLWPGESYRILAGFALALKPNVVIDIGTHYGGSALVFHHFLPQASVSTFDIIPWNHFENTLLKQTDFKENFTQYVDDLSNDSNILKHQKLLESADLFYIDAAKDGIMEYKLMEHFAKINLKKNAILIFDDIRLWNMLKLWRQIKYPKLDLTSFGHWTGTGVVQIT